MNLILQVNQQSIEVDIQPGDSLLKVLRTNGYFGVKHGCETGECGACAVLIDGKPVNSCVLLAAQAEGHSIETIETLGEHPEQGWKTTAGLHPLQQAFVETGAIQCGYCTPAQLLAAQSLLEKNPDPSEEAVREALSGVLCRCTGYLKPVQAVLRAAAVLRGETVESISSPTSNKPLPAPDNWLPAGDSPETLEDSGPTGGQVTTRSSVLPRIWVSSANKTWQQVGKPEQKVDAIKLVQGKPAFTADFDRRGMLVAKVLHSPHAHARIRSIDTTAARALPGVAAVLTWQDIPRVVYSTAGQSDPIPGPLDAFSLDNKVRFVGDRVAFVAAETAEIAEQALKLIQVDYEISAHPARSCPGAAKQFTPPARRAGVCQFCRFGCQPEPGCAHPH